MRWLCRLLGRIAGKAAGEQINSARLIAKTKRLLRQVMKIQIRKAKANPIVPRDYRRRCDKLFHEHIDDIAVNAVYSTLRNELANYAYQDTASGIFMVVSVLPWTTKEAIQRLFQASDDKAYGYVTVLTEMFLNAWPSPDLRYYFHIILCVGGGEFQMHTAMGDYGGFPKAKRDFTVLPFDLLNDHERSWLAGG